MQPTRCPARYERPGGAERGDRIVKCHLPAGHPGEHEEADTEVTWIDENTSSAQTIELGSVESLRAEVNLLRTRLANVKQAKSRLFARIIANAHLLDTPFSNQPDLSPWDLLKRDMHAVNAALRVSAEERSDDKSKVVIFGNPCCGGNGDEASCRECREVG